MKEIKLVVCKKPLLLVKGEINLIVLSDSSCEIEIDVPNRLHVLSYNMFIKNEKTITTNDFVGELPYFDLTKAYIDSIAENLDKNLVLLIKIGGVDPKGHKRIFNFLNEIIDKVAAIILFEEFRFLSQSFILNEGCCFQLLGNQVSSWKPRDFVWKNI